jgi:hypothetical protein
MKTYTKFINEFAFFDKWKHNRKIDKTFDNISTNYPGVQEFLMAAKEWAHEVDPDVDPVLYKLLDSLKRKKSINDLTEKDLRKLYKFLVRRRLDTYDDMVTMFINASEGDNVR